MKFRGSYQVQSLGALSYENVFFVNDILLKYNRLFQLCKRLECICYHMLQNGGFSNGYIQCVMGDMSP